MISALFVFISGFFFFPVLRKLFFISFPRLMTFYLWHSFFCLFYFWYVDANGGDAVMYYESSLQPGLSFHLGTRGVIYLTSMLTNGVGLSFLAVSLVYQFFGFIGLVAFDSSLRDVTWHKGIKVRTVATLVIFLPSVSFWSSGLGKDSLAFFSVGLALWSSIFLRDRWVYLFISICVMFLVRPHMAGMLVLALSGSYIFQSKIPLSQRILLGGFAVIASIFLVPLALDYAGVSEQEGFLSYIEGRQSHNLSGGGAVDISVMSPPVQMFTYLFRPTLIEARNLFSLAAALDNTILLFLFIAGGWALIRKPLPAHLLAHNRMFLWIYSLGAWLVLAMTTANLGIALRQKWMFAPMLIFLLISVIGRSRAPLEQFAVLQSEGRE